MRPLTGRIMQSCMNFKRRDCQLNCMSLTCVRTGRAVSPRTINGQTSHAHTSYKVKVPVRLLLHSYVTSSSFVTLCACVGSSATADVLSAFVFSCLCQHERGRSSSRLLAQGASARFYAGANPAASTVCTVLKACLYLPRTCRWRSASLLFFW